MSVTVDDRNRVIGGDNGYTAEQLFKELNAQVGNKHTGVAAELAQLAENTKQTSKQFEKILEPAIKKFSDEIKDLSKQFEDLNKELAKIKENNKKYWANKPTTAKSSTDKNLLSPSFIRKAEKFFHEGTTGHSLHVHDYTVASLLKGIANDIKRFGMIIENAMQAHMPKGDQNKFVETFERYIDQIAKSERGHGRGSLRRMTEGEAARHKAIAEGSLKTEEKVIAGVNRIGEKLIQEGERSIEQGKTLRMTQEQYENSLVKVNTATINIEKTFEQVADNIAETGLNLGRNLRNNAHHFDQQRHKMLELGLNLTSLAQNTHTFQKGKDPQKIAQVILEASRKSSMSPDKIREFLAKGVLSEQKLENINLSIRQLHEYNKADRHRIKEAIKELVDKDLYSEESGKIIDKLDKISRSAQYQQDKRERREAWEDIAKRWTDNISYYTTLLERFAPYQVGVGQRYDAQARMGQIRDEHGAWMRDIHLTLAQNQGMLGTLHTRAGNPFGYRTNNDQDLTAIYNEANELARDFNRTGQSTAKINAVLLKNMQRGITLQSRWRDLSRQGLQLGRMIGVDAEQTSDELANWNQYMGFSVRQTSQLARDMQQISVITGVTGERLLNAAKAGRQLAENMRSAGTLTSEAARFLTQFSAAASRRGTENVSNPIMQALTSSVNLFRSSPGIMALMMQAAQRGGVMRQLQTGSIPNNRESQRNFARGLQDIVMQFTGGRGLDQLSPNERMMLNLQTNSAFETQLDDIQRIADTLLEGSMTTSDRVADIERQLRNPNLTTEERGNLTSQMTRLRQLETGEQMNEALRALNQAATSGTTPGNATALFNQVFAGMTNASRHLRGPAARAQQDVLNRAVTQFQGRLPAAIRDQTTMNELIRDISNLVDDSGVWERMYQLDQSTFQRENQERHQREVFEQGVLRALDHIITWSPPQASLANTYAGIFRMVETLGLIYLAVNALRFGSFLTGGTQGTAGASAATLSALRSVGLIAGTGLAVAGHAGIPGDLAAQYFGARPNGLVANAANIGTSATGTFLATLSATGNPAIAAIAAGGSALTTAFAELWRASNALSNAKNRETQLTLALIELQRGRRQLLTSEAGRAMIRSELETSTPEQIMRSLNLRHSDVTARQRDLQLLQDLNEVQPDLRFRPLSLEEITDPQRRARLQTWWDAQQRANPELRNVRFGSGAGFFDALQQARANASGTESRDNQLSSAQERLSTAHLEESTRIDQLGNIFGDQLINNLPANARTDENIQAVRNYAQALVGHRVLNARLDAEMQRTTARLNNTVSAGLMSPERRDELLQATSSRHAALFVASNEALTQARNQLRTNGLDVSAIDTSARQQVNRLFTNINQPLNADATLAPYVGNPAFATTIPQLLAQPQSGSNDILQTLFGFGLPGTTGLPTPIVNGVPLAPTPTTSPSTPSPTAQYQQQQQREVAPMPIREAAEQLNQVGNNTRDAAESLQTLIDLTRHVLNALTGEVFSGNAPSNNTRPKYRTVNNWFNASNNPLLGGTKQTL